VLHSKHTTVYYCTNITATPCPTLPCCVRRCRYPLLESLQRFLWPRLCVLDQKTLYAITPFRILYATKDTLPYIAC